MDRAGRAARAGALELLVAVLLAAAALLVARTALLAPGVLLVEFGPNDADYTRDFRSDWEREGPNRFHWTTVRSRVELPVRIEGPGHVLRIRMRRHLPEPAHVRLAVEGRTVSAFDIQADPHVPYRVVEVPLPDLTGRQPFELTIDAPSASPRPLGIALDWLEIEPAGDGRLAPLPVTWVHLAAVVALAFLLPRAGGLSRRAALAMASVFAAVLAAGLAADFIAVERMLRLGILPFAAGGLLAVAIVLAPPFRRAFAVERGAVTGGLIAIAMAAIALRLALLLHPQYYYPDVRIHAMFAWQLGRHGFERFLQDYTDNQFRYSLGLQQEGAHWYAFPYPPGFYVLAAPLLSWFRSDVAVSALAAMINGLTAVGAFAVARQLGRRAGTALGAAVVAALLPLYVVRLTLGYFPALAGHAMDVIVLVFLLRRADRGWGARDLAAFTLLMTGAMLVYTQTVLNFAVLLGPYLLLDFARDRSRPALRRQAGIVAGCVLGGLVALGVFYHRYVPAIEAMSEGRPMAGEAIAIERLERQARVAAAANELQVEEQDPYAGPTLDPWRGLRKAAWRLWVFYGPFSLAVIGGLLLVLARRPESPALGPGALRFVACWAAAYVLLNLLSGGLPGPNLVRYNKDLELVAALFCVAVAVLGEALWSRSGGIARKLPALAYAGSFLLWAGWRTVRAEVERFSLER